MDSNWFLFGSSIGKHLQVIPMMMSFPRAVIVIVLLLSVNKPAYFVKKNKKE